MPRPISKPEITPTIDGGWLIEVGGYKFDVFPTDAGDLGLTFYDPKNKDAHVNVFVDQNLVFGGDVRRKYFSEDLVSVMARY